MKNTLVGTLMGLSLLLCEITSGMSSDGIFSAIESGSVESVQTILNKDKTNLKARNKNGCTPLIFAIENGKEDIARLLIESGADLEAKNAYEYKTPLSAAIAIDNQDLAKFLIEKGVKVSPDGLTVTTPLWEAVKKSIETKKRDMLKILLDAGADLNDKLQNGDTVLHRVAIKRDLDLLKFLLENSKVKIDLDKIGLHGNLLMIAAHNFDIDMARFLIEKGAKVNVSCEATSVLHQVADGAKEKIEALQREKANVSEMDSVVDSARKMVDFLIENGANASATDWYGETPDDLWTEIDNMLKSEKAKNNSAI